MMKEDYTNTQINTQIINAKTQIVIVLIRNIYRTQQHTLRDKRFLLVCYKDHSLGTETYSPPQYKMEVDLDRSGTLTEPLTFHCFHRNGPKLPVQYFPLCQDRPKVRTLC